MWVTLTVWLPENGLIHDLSVMPFAAYTAAVSMY
jgi:hypothetical protein